MPPAEWFAQKFAHAPQSHIIAIHLSALTYLSKPAAHRAARQHCTQIHVYNVEHTHRTQHTLSKIFYEWALTSHRPSKHKVNERAKSNAESTKIGRAVSIQSVQKKCGEAEHIPMKDDADSNYTTAVPACMLFTNCLKLLKLSPLKSVFERRRYVKKCKPLLE